MSDEKENNQEDVLENSEQNLEGAEEGGEGEGSEVNKEPSPEEAVEDLRKQLEEERAKREEAQREAEEAKKASAQASGKAESAQAQALQAAEDKLESDKASAEASLKDLNRQYKEAYESGDSDKLIEINDKIMDVKLNVRRMDDYKVQLQNYKDNIGKQQKTDVENQEVYTKESKKWIDEHPEFNSSAAFREKAIRAHHAAVGEGIQPDTPDYFSFIDKKMGLVKEDDSQTENKQTRVMAGAPPSKGSAIKPSGGRFVRLTEAQKEAAEICGMSEAEYAKFLQENN